jgi:V-type H+-transporting ATPase subunit d
LQEFHHIGQCDNLEDVKLNLQETDYGNFLQNEPSPLSSSAIRDKALDKLVNEFEYLRSQAVGVLAKFLDYIVIDYMIDNVMLILKATLNNPNVNLEDLVAQRHPLGDFKPSTLKAICQFQNNSKGYAELYQTVLIDTPIGPYFQQFLKEIAETPGAGSGSSGLGASDVRNVLEEMPTTKLENTLRKLYLEDFYNFCHIDVRASSSKSRRYCY